MTTRNVFFTERGFGNSHSGRSHVIAGPNGEPLPLRIVTLCLPKPNGSIGGELVIVPLADRNPRSKSCINNKEIVYEISIDRTENFSNIQIRQINARTMETEIYHTAFMPGSNGEGRFIESEGMKDSNKAKELLTTILTDAVNQALKRSYNSMPEKLYYGTIATDAKPIKRELFDKSKEFAKV